jgi:hypothetical protein
MTSADQEGFWRFAADVAYGILLIVMVRISSARVPAYILYEGDSTISFWHCQERRRRDYADIDRKTTVNR